MSNACAIGMKPFINRQLAKNTGHPGHIDCNQRLQSFL